MQDGTFTPRGPTYYVDSTAPVQVLSTDNVSYTSVRVVNLSASISRFAWMPGQIGVPGPASVTVTTPSAGIPSPRTLAMEANAVETFMINNNAWFQAQSGTFEITAGEGL